MKTATLDRFGRIVIPKQVREVLGLETGAILCIEEAGEDTIALRALREQPAVRTKEGVTVFSGRAEGDLEGAVQRHRKGRLRQLSPRRRK